MRTSLQTIHSVEGDTGGSMKELLDSQCQKWYIRDNFQKFVFNWSTTTTSNAIEAASKFSFTCSECDILYTLGIHLPPPRKDEFFLSRISNAFYITGIVPRTGEIGLYVYPTVCPVPDLEQLRPCAS